MLSHHYDQLGVQINNLVIQYITSTTPFLHLSSVINVAEEREEGNRIHYLEGHTSKRLTSFLNSMLSFRDYFPVG